MTNSRQIMEVPTVCLDDKKKQSYDASNVEYTHSHGAVARPKELALAGS